MSITGGPCFDSDPIWLRRLRSSWGTLEMRRGSARKNSCNRSHLIETDTYAALFRACRRMYLDMVDFAIEPAKLCVTDLGTFDYILQRAHNPSPAASTTSQYLATAITLIRDLSLMLRLSLAEFTTLESAIIQEHPKTLSSNATTWTTIYPNISGYGTQDTYADESDSGSIGNSYVYDVSWSSLDEDDLDDNDVDDDDSDDHGIDDEDGESDEEGYGDNE
ncbi:hypothetical protein BCR34DRAFT_585670 [Clohesyomyces aquaticus]|uniref:Uncharacterized protein n=1 Tax=Clohesyomyces aquaticus TaxID=1231657 RepID=A0A1Y1ZWT0_9PLEO|nr:hypothetical protein BCR34DRAFT_585670 [Clohesyomyces aquaticus]